MRKATHIRTPIESNMSTNIFPTVKLCQFKFVCVWILQQNPHFRKNIFAILLSAQHLKENSCDYIFFAKADLKPNKPTDESYLFAWFKRKNKRFHKDSSTLGQFYPRAKNCSSKNIQEKIYMKTLSFLFSYVTSPARWCATSQFVSTF